MQRKCEGGMHIGGEAKRGQKRGERGGVYRKASGTDTRTFASFSPAVNEVPFFFVSLICLSDCTCRSTTIHIIRRFEVPERSSAVEKRSRR